MDTVERYKAVSSRRGVERIGHTEVDVVPSETAEVAPTRLLLAFDTKILRPELCHMGLVDLPGLLYMVNELLVAPVQIAMVYPDEMVSRRHGKKGSTRRTL